MLAARPIGVATQRSDVAFGLVDKRRLDGKVVFRVGRARALLGTVGALALSLLGTQPAQASPTLSEVAAYTVPVAEAVDPDFFDVAVPESFPPVPGAETGEPVTFETVADSVSTSITENGQTAITVGATSFTMSRCTMVGAFCGTSVWSQSEQISATTDAFTSGDASSMVVERDQNETRHLIYIEGAAAPTDYHWSLSSGKTFVVAPDGAILVQDGAGNTLGAVHPSWGRDANGATVSTSYSVNGGILTLHVAHTGAAYPVVADPRISFGWYIYVRYSRAEVQSIWARLAVWGWQYVVPSLCVAIPSVLPAIACATVLNIYGGSIAATINAARQNNQCLEFRFTYAPRYLVGWRNYSC